MTRKTLIPGLFCLTALLSAACQSPPQFPPAEEIPSAALEFERAEAVSIEQIALHFRLTVNNPLSRAVDLGVNDWNCLLNGIALSEESASLTLGNTGTAAAFSSAEQNLILRLNLKDIASLTGADSDDCRVELNVELDNHLMGTASAGASFPQIREPQFTITSIAIVQADLINTRFKITLKIDNPNVFPVTLASFGYELYGDGRFWGDGSTKNLLSVPAQSAAETNFEFEMNFINMKRQLLDDIIAMRQVRYRFTGNVEVQTGVSWLPVFALKFEQSGNSEVVKK